jgi:small subunit ribosomal protein S9
MVMDSKVVTGKRKKAIARAHIRDGTGVIRVNSLTLDNIMPVYVREKIRLPIKLAEDMVDMKKIDIDVTVEGGGVMGQSDAIASSIARGLVEYTQNDDLHSKIIRYDRTLIAGDHRMTEAHKPGQSSKGPRHKRQKSYR